MLIFFIKNKRLIVFLFLMAEGVFIINSVRWVGGVYADTWLHWDFLASNIFTEEGFDFLRPEWYHKYQTKGYFFIFILALIQKAASIINFPPLKLFQICNVMFFACFMTYFIPIFAKKLFKLRDEYKPSLISYLLFSQLIVYFFNGYLFYPLSDFPAILLYFIGLYFILEILATPPPHTLIVNSQN